MSLMELDVPASEVEQPILARVMENTIKSYIPFNVIVELTYKCNLRCKHCYIPEPSRHQKELTTQELERVLDELADLRCLYLTLTGGEVFLRPDFFRLAWYAKNLGFALKVFTNGTLISPEIADKLAELHPFTVEISIYGAKNDTHDFVTKARGSFRKSMDAVRMIAERGVRVKAKMPLMAHSLDEYDELMDECEALGVECKLDHSLSPMDDGSKDPLSLRTTGDQLYQIFTDKRISPRGHLPSYPSQICEAGRNTLSVNPMGDVFPCLQLPIKAGNVRERSLVDIWNNSIVIDKLRALQESDLHSCPTCSVKSYCNRCPGMALLEDGDYLGCSSRSRQVAEVRQKVAQDYAAGLLRVSDEPVRRRLVSLQEHAF